MCILLGLVCIIVYVRICVHVCIHVYIPILAAPPIAHIKTPNSLFDWDASPLRLNMKIFTMELYI